MNNYSTYTNKLSGEKLSFDDMCQILTDLNNCITNLQAADKMEFYNDFLSKAFKYAEIRSEWELLENEERAEKDAYRTALHNSFITSVNVLGRLCEAEGVDSSWRLRLSEDRKVIGDFACFVAYMNGICNR